MCRAQVFMKKSETLVHKLHQEFAYGALKHGILSR